MEAGFKIPLPSTMHELSAMDFMGLSWILTDDDMFSKEIIMGEK
ncbi:MAG: hypothetical protein OER78_00310 [Nitrosopumilus sp.]|nr:hypothetical protein [Nitrosopumilus sp.]MDH3854658.1 hypothetical protein [Nitrosopumilus sp.]